MLGKTILHYKILEKLGEGGMGVVYKAEDTRLKRNVAIKFLPRYIAGNEEDRERFHIEAQAAASLNHPNIMQIYSIEEFEDELFIVMELIEGTELKTRLNQSSFSVDETLDIAKKIVRGLIEAHSKGIIHRDIKSSNIMCTGSGKVKIMDFGLAKIHGSSDVTKMGTTLGTTSYMSPEQFSGKKIDFRTDIWAIGILLYEMLTGKMPFSGAYEQAVMYSILNEEPENIEKYNEDVSDKLKAIISKCLEKDPDKRFQTAEELLEALENPGSGSNKSIEEKISIYDKINSKFKSKVTYGIGATFSLILLLYFFFFSGPNFLTRLFYDYNLSSKQNLIVLPFTNIGNNQENQAFCDGLVETLTSKLTELEAYSKSLMVVPASEVRSYDIKSPSEAQKSFGVNLAVTGSFQLFQNMIRLTLNLVDTENMRQINSKVIDVPESDFIKLQDNSVITLVNMLDLELNSEAENVIKEESTTNPGAYEYYLQGLGYLQRYEQEDNLNIAEELFKEAINEDSVYALAYSALGETYWRKYELLKDVSYIDLANLLCEKAYKIDKNLAPVNKTLGMINYGTGNYSDAVEHFDRAIEIDPKSAESYRGLAKTYEALKLPEKAEEIYKKAIELKPGYWAGYNDLGVFYYKNNELEKAAQEFTRVTVLTPDNYKGYNNLGGTYYRMEEWDKAKEMFEKSFAINQTYSVASNLGTIYYIEGNFDKAIEKYRLAIELNDNDFLMWGNLGSAYYWSKKNKSKAIEAYKRAIRLAEKQNEINPNDPDIISHLAGYNSMLGNKDATISYLKIATQLAPENLEIMYRTAAALERIGEREKAVQWLTKSIENGYSKADIFNQPEFQSLLKDEKFTSVFSNN